MRPVNHQNFSDLIGQIYDAPLQVDGWRRVLAELPKYTLTNVQNFVELNLSPPGSGLPLFTPVGFCTQGLSVGGEMSLMTDWSYRIPITYDLINHTVRHGQAVATTDQTSPDFDFEHSAFYHECALPNDFRYMLGCSALSSDRKSLFILSLNRAKRYGPFENSDGQLLQALLPHLLRAHRIGQTLRELQLVQGIQGSALDQCARPVFGLNVRGQLLYANAPAEALLHAGTVFQAHHGTLHINQPSEQNALLHALHRAAQIGTDITGQPGEHLTFSRDSPPPLTGLLLPVQRTHPERGFALILKDPSARPTPPMQLLQHLYGLTPAEARVASLIADGLTPEEIAAHLGNTTGTVRNQLKQVFIKTGVRRQSDMIRLTLNLT